MWNFTSSVFMNFGGADRTLHPQFFRAVTFESQSLAEEKTFVVYLAATNASVVELQHGATVDACATPLQGNVGSGESHSGGMRGFPADLLIDVFGANLVVTAATGLTSNGRCPCVPLTWWTTIRKTFSTRWSTTVWTDTLTTRSTSLAQRAW